MIDKKDLSPTEIADELDICPRMVGRYLSGFIKANVVELSTRLNDSGRAVVIYRKKVKTKGSQIIKFDSKKMQEKLVQQDRLIHKDRNKLKFSASGSSLNGIY